MTIDHRLSLTLLLAGSALLTSCSYETSSSQTILSSLAPRSHSTSTPLPFSWPPERGAAYPDVTLLDHRGEEVHLSSFKGKVLLVDLIGMT